MARTTTLTYLIEMRARDAKRETQGLGKAAKGTSKDLDTASESAKGLSRSTKQASGDLKGLSRNLRNVGRTLGGVSSKAGGSTKALSAVAGGIGGLAVAGGPAALALVAVVGGLVAGGIAAVAFAAGVADATVNAREYSAQLQEIEGLGSIFSPVPEETLQSLERSAQGLTALKTTVTAISLAFAEEFAPEIETVTLLFVSLGLVVADFAREAIDKLRRFFQAIDAMGPKAQRALGFVTAGVSDQLRMISKSLEEGTVRSGSYLGRAQELIGSLNDTETAARGAASGIAAQTEALSALATASAEFERDHGGGEFASDPFRGSAAQENLRSLGVLPSRTAVSSSDLSMLAEIRLLNDLTRGLITADQYDQGVAAINSQLEDTAVDIAQAPIARSRIDSAQLSQGIGAAGSVVSGDILGAAAVGGPVVAAVATLIQGVAILGQRGTGEIADELEQFRRDLMEGIALLPSLFGELIPAFADALAESLPQALIDMLPDLLAAISELTDPMGQLERGAGAIESLEIPVISKIVGVVGDALGWFNDLADRGIPTDQDLGLGSRDQGGSIGRPGYYFLHPGEEVIRNNGGMSHRASSGRSQRSVSINLHTPGIFPFVYQLDRATGSGGLREEY